LSADCTFCESQTIGDLSLAYNVFNPLGLVVKGSGWKWHHDVTSSHVLKLEIGTASAERAS